MSTLWLQADGLCRGEEHDVPSMRTAFLADRARSRAFGFASRNHQAPHRPKRADSERSKGFGEASAIASSPALSASVKHEVTDAATSTNCPGCSTHIDLRDYKITTPFSRSIRTRGELHLTAKGDLSSTSVICRSAIIEGKLRGNLQCEESATINFVGKIPGRLTANYVCVERKADVQCYRRVRVGTIDIKGRMSGEIVASGAVTIHKTGVLDGNVTAKSLTIDKGGIFSGGLVIGQGDLQQAELLTETTPLPTESAADSEQPSIPPATAQPLPAT